MRVPVAITDSTFAPDNEALSPVIPTPALFQECIELSLRALRLHADTLDVVRSRRGMLGEVSLRRARLAVLVAGKCGRDLMKALRALASTVNHRGVFIDKGEYVSETVESVGATLEYVRRRLELGESAYSELTACGAGVNVSTAGGRRRLARQVLTMVGKVLSREVGLVRLLGMAIDLESRLWGIFFDTLMHPSDDANQDEHVRLQALIRLEDMHLHVNDLWETVDYLDYWWYCTLGEIIGGGFASTPTPESKRRLNVAMRVGREIIRGTFRRIYWVTCKKVPNTIPRVHHDSGESWDSFDDILASISMREVLISCTSREEVYAHICDGTFGG